jgi:hypothetical protein
VEATRTETQAFVHEDLSFNEEEGESEIGESVDELGNPKRQDLESEIGEPVDELGNPMKQETLKSLDIDSDDEEGELPDVEAAADAGGGMGGGPGDMGGGLGGGGMNDMMSGLIATALASTVATAASMTEFVRSRTRPAEYQATKEREQAKLEGRSRREWAEIRLRRAIVPPMDVGRAQLAVVEAKEALVGAPFINLAETRIKEHLDRLNRLRAGQRLEVACKTGIRTRSLPMTRGAGSSEDGPVGMARRILDSAEQELQEAIREAKEWGLNVDAIRFGEKILRDLKSISATASKASPAGVSSSRAPVARPPKARPPPPPPMSQPTPPPTQPPIPSAEAAAGGVVAA